MYNFIIMMDNEISIQSTQNKIDSNNKLHSSDKVQNRDWLQTLPYPHIIFTDGPFDHGKVIEMNSDKWHGIYKPQKSEYEDGFLTLEPFIGENNNILYLSPDTFVDTNHAKIEDNGEISPKLEDGWKILLPSMEEVEDKKEDTTSLDYLLKHSIENSLAKLPKYYTSVYTKPKEGDIPEEKDGVPLIFRGIDYKLMRKFIINGKTKSGEFEQGLPQLDKSNELFFADYPEMAFEYAARGNGISPQPTFEQPSYVFSIKMPNSNILRHSAHEVVLDTKEKGLHLEDLVSIYEIRPYKIISSQKIYLRESHIYKAMLFEGQFILLAPRAYSIYREVKVEDIYFD